MNFIWDIGSTLKIIGNISDLKIVQLHYGTKSYKRLWKDTYVVFTVLTALGTVPGTQ